MQTGDALATPNSGSLLSLALSLPVGSRHDAHAPIHPLSHEGNAARGEEEKKLVAISALNPALLNRPQSDSLLFCIGISARPLFFHPSLCQAEVKALRKDLRLALGTSRGILSSAGLGAVH